MARRKYNPDDYKGIEIYLTRVRLNSQGYAAGKYGQYYGTGAPVFTYDSWPYDANIEGSMRAPSRSAALAALKAKYPGAKVK
jgi:hypothetical protein